MKTEHSGKTEWFEWYESLTFALVILVLLFVFGARVIQVSGESMLPTLNPNDRVAVQSMFYTPEYGDIVVVDGYTRYGDPLIKRVIATGGDTVELDPETGIVSRNGEPLQEAYISAPTGMFDVEFPLTVPEGCVFVMGDNRPFSLDSRSSDVGFINEKDIMGKVLFRIMPLNRMGKV